MKCYCCSTKRKFFESFAEVDTEYGKIFLCPYCNDLLYKIRDSFNANNKKQNKRYYNELQKRKKNSQEAYSIWEEKFIKNNLIQ